MGIFQSSQSRGMSFAAAVLVLSAPCAAATFNGFASVNGTLPGQSEQSFAGLLGEPGFVSRNLAVQGQTGDGAGSLDLQARASVTYGHLRASSSGAATLDTTGVNTATVGLASAGGSMTDSFIIQCATCEAGTFGTLLFNVTFEGTWDLSGTISPGGGEALHAGDVSFNAALNLRAEGVPNPPHLPDETPPPNPGTLSRQVGHLELLFNDYHEVNAYGDGFGNGIDPLSIQFVFGQPIQVTMALSTSLRAIVASREVPERVTGSAQSFADFSRGFSWGGITSVIDGSGQAVTSFTAFNNVGVDYAQALAVPEPGTWGLMLMGAVGLLGLRAIRRMGLATHQACGWTHPRSA